MAIILVCLFALNDISWALAPTAGNPQVYQLMQQVMEKKLDFHQNPIDEFIRQNRNKARTLSSIPHLEEEFIALVNACGANNMLSRLKTTLVSTGGQIQIIFVKSENDLPVFEGKKVWGHAGTYVTVFALEGEKDTKEGRKKIIGRLFEQIRARSKGEKEFAELTFAKNLSVINRDYVMAEAEGPSPDSQEEFVSRLHSDFKEEMSAIMRRSNADKEISGFQYSEEISAVLRKYVIKIFEFCQAASAARYNTTFDKVMLCASGGTFFRGEMSPLSDVDYAIVFDDHLLPFRDVFLNQFEAVLKRVTGVKPDLHDVSAIERAMRRGYVNVIDFCVARETMFLAGDNAMYHGFEELLQNYIQQATRRDDYIIENLMFDLLYSGAKWEEAGPSVDKVNIKKHRGGLRSINKIIFAMQLIEDRIGFLGKSTDEINNMRSLTLREKQLLKNAQNFLLSVRNALHYMSMPKVTDILDMNSVRKIAGTVNWAGSTAQLDEQMHNALEGIAGTESKVRGLAIAKVKSLNNISELSKKNDLVSAILTACYSREISELRNVYKRYRGNWTLSMFLAINEHTPADILNELGVLPGYDNRDIRMSVAFNKSSPDMLLAQLMDDEIIHVQAAARLNLIKKYPDISEWLDAWSTEKQAEHLRYWLSKRSAGAAANATSGVRTTNKSLEDPRGGPGVTPGTVFLKTPVHPGGEEPNEQSPADTFARSKAWTAGYLREDSTEFLLHAIDLYFNDTPMSDLSTLSSLAYQMGPDSEKKITREQREGINEAMRPISEKRKEIVNSDSYKANTKDPEEARQFVRMVISLKTDQLKLADELVAKVSNITPGNKILCDLARSFRNKVERFFTELESRAAKLGINASSTATPAAGLPDDLSAKAKPDTKHAPAKAEAKGESTLAKAGAAAEKEIASPATFGGEARNDGVDAQPRNDGEKELAAFEKEWEAAKLDERQFLSNLSPILGLETVLDHDKPVFVFSDMVTFDNNLAKCLPKLAGKGIKVAVIVKADNDRGRALIKALNEGKTADKKILHADTIEGIRQEAAKAKVSAPRFYYFRMKDSLDPTIDGRNITTYDLLPEQVKRIIDAIGSACHVEPEKLPLLHEVARRFA